MSIFILSVLIGMAAAISELMDVIRDRRVEGKHWHDTRIRMERERDAYRQRRGMKYSWR